MLMLSKGQGSSSSQLNMTLLNGRSSFILDQKLGKNLVSTPAAGRARNPEIQFLAAFSDSTLP